MKHFRIIISLVCLISFAAAPHLFSALLQSSGKLKMLRINQVGSKYGPGTDQIDAEVIIQLDSKPGMAFGFKLRNNWTRPVRQGMLDLLRDAYANDLTVTIDYDIAAGKKNGIIVRVVLKK